MAVTTVVALANAGNVYLESTHTSSADVTLPLYVFNANNFTTEVVASSANAGILALLEGSMHGNSGGTWTTIIGLLIGTSDTAMTGVASAQPWRYIRHNFQYATSSGAAYITMRTVASPY